MPSLIALFRLFPRLFLLIITLRWKKLLDVARSFKLLRDSGLFDTSAGTNSERVLRYLLQDSFHAGYPHPLFDSAWYLQTNPDVATSGMNPLVHYLRQGWRENRNPHPLFDGDWYLRQNPDVAAAGVAPLLHYLRQGWRENRNPHPLFDAGWYLKQYPDAAVTGADPFINYLMHGRKEKRNPHPSFESVWYSRQSTDPTAQCDPLLHYIAVGALQGLDPNPYFDTSFYLATYPDIAARTNPLIHYVTHGAAEGRLPNHWAGNLQVETLPTIADEHDWDTYARNRIRTLLGSEERFPFPLPESPETTIILFVGDEACLCAPCLDALIASDYKNYRLVILNQQTNQEIDTLMHRCDAATILQEEEPTDLNNICLRASSPFLVFLDARTLIEPAAISSALKDLEADRTGAVGAKILSANGALRDAGMIIWRDGSCTGYGELDRANSLKYEAKRPVDACSQTFLATTSRMFRDVGGFDCAYVSRTYRYADYCMKVWAAGFPVLYSPLSIIRRYALLCSEESDPAASALSLDRARFVSKWISELSKHPKRDERLWLRARVSSQASGLRIVYVDDSVPKQKLGTGLPRSKRILLELVRLGHHVTCASMHFPVQSAAIEYAETPRDIELFDVSGNVKEFYEQYVPNADVIWISRPHNFARFIENATKIGKLTARIVFDAEAIYTDRDRLYVTQTNKILPEKILAVLERRELALAAAADAVVVVSSRDEAKFRREGISNIYVLKDTIPVSPTSRSFGCRNTLLSVGAIHEPENPNADAMRYFATAVWPELQRRVDGELVLAGYGTNSFLNDIAAEGIRIVGSVDDLTPLYDEARVFIAATRFSAGVPLKVYEAAAMGVPAVVSRLLAEQVGWQDGRDFLVAEDALSFVTLCVRLYRDPNLWEQLRTNALSRVRAELGHASFSERISEILASLVKV